MTLQERWSDRVEFDARWAAAYDEYDAVLSAFCEVVLGSTDTMFHLRPAPARWTAAELALHVRQAYEMGRAAAQGGPSMQLRVPPLAAWVSRRVVLPLMLALKRFPRGAPVPREVVPDVAAAATLTTARAVMELRDSAEAAFQALWRAQRETPRLRVTHAYFGPLSPYQTVRLLSAHTRHHVGGIIERRLAVR